MNSLQHVPVAKHLILSCKLPGDSMAILLSYIQFELRTHQIAELLSCNTSACCFKKLCNYHSSPLTSFSCSFFVWDLDTAVITISLIWNKELWEWRHFLLGRLSYSKIPRALSNWLSRRILPRSSGYLYQHLTTFATEKVFLMFKWKFWFFSLCPPPLHCTSLKWVWLHPSCSLPSYIGYTWITSSPPYVFHLKAK